MQVPYAHDMMPLANHDELAREQFDDKAGMVFEPTTRPAWCSSR